MINIKSNVCMCYSCIQIFCKSCHLKERCKKWFFFSLQKEKNASVDVTIRLFWIVTPGLCVCKHKQVLLSLDEHVLLQVLTVTRVAQTSGLSPCIFMSTHYQEEASVGLLGVKLSGGWPSLAVGSRPALQLCEQADPAMLQPQHD